MESFSHPLGLALCGVGARARVVFGELLQTTNQVRLRSVYDPDPTTPSRLRGWPTPDADFRFVPSMEELLADDAVDWVGVSSPNAQHAVQIIAALQAGKHVFSEKPLAPNFADCLAIRDVVAASDRTFVFGLVLRSSPFYLRVKELVDAGVIGEILSFEFNETLPFQHGAFIMGDWRRRQEDAGSLVLEKCCHDIDLANWLTGSLPRRVAAMGDCRFYLPKNARHSDRIGPNALGHPAYQSWEERRGANPFTSDKSICDNQVVLLEYANGAKATFHTNLHAALPERRFYLLGSEGAIRANVLTGEIEWCRIAHEPVIHREQSDAKGGHGGGDGPLVESLLATMLDNAPPLAGIQEALLASAVCFAIDEANTTGTVVDLQPYWDSVGEPFKSVEFYQLPFDPDSAQLNNHSGSILAKSA